MSRRKGAEGWGWDAMTPAWSSRQQCVQNCKLGQQHVRQGNKLQSGAWEGVPQEGVLWGAGSRKAVPVNSCKRLTWLATSFSSNTQSRL